VLVKVENGVAYMKALAVDTLKVGSREKRTGITLYDEVTGEPYCLSVANGATKTIAGECVVIEADVVFVPSTEPTNVNNGGQVSGEQETPVEEPPLEVIEVPPGEEIPTTDVSVEEPPLEVIEVPPGEEIPATDVSVEEIIEPIQTSETAPVIEEVVLPTENLSEEITP